MRIKPYGDYVLVYLTSIPRVGDVLVPPMFQEYPLEAVVVDVGDEVKEVKVGDVVVYNVWGMKPLPFLLNPERDLLLIREKDLLAKVIR